MNRVILNNKNLFNPASTFNPIKGNLFSISFQRSFFQKTNSKKEQNEDIEIVPNLHFLKPLPVRLEFSSTNPPLDSKALEAIEVSNDYHRRASK